MGFDLSGMNPNMTRPQPKLPPFPERTDKDWEAYHDWQDENCGVYFRNSVWEWRPLWDFITATCNDILTEENIKGGDFNDGHKISKTKAKKIAARLRKIDKDLEDHQIGHERHMDSIPDEDCNLCYGTGRRNDDIGVSARNADPNYTCNGCNGKGTRRPFETSYPFNAENVREFERFCEKSGGFEIC